MPESQNPTPETLMERFKMTHLVPESTAAAKTAVEEAVQPPRAKNEPDTNDPRFQKQYPFAFEWRDSRGKLWVGDFENTILTLRHKSMVGVMRAKLAGGVPAEALDPVTAELNLMVSHLTFSLTKVPDWAEDLMALDDQELVGQLFDKAMEHERFFRSDRSAPAAGQSGGQ